MRRSDPLIVGGGPAGSAAAIALARGGAKPLILERVRETGDALCGGFLSWETLQALDRLGVGQLAAHPIAKLRLWAGSQSATARLPALAVGVSRHRLDTVMLKVAEAAGAGIERGVSARAFEGGVLSCDGATFEPDSLFLATGKHDLRGTARPRANGDATLGLRVRLAPHRSLRALLEHHIELHLFDRGYAGLLLQEDDSGNLCLAVRKSRLTQAGGDPAVLLRQLGDAHPALGERLAFMHGDAVIDAIASVPYGWRALDSEAGLFRLGDQAAVIASLAGEGIGIALASGIAAGAAWTRGGRAAAPAWQRNFAARTARPVALAQLLWNRSETVWSAALGVRMVATVPSLAKLFARMTRIGD